MRELLFQVDLTNRTAAEAEDIDIFDAGMLKRIAVLAGLDMYSFAKCFNSGRHRPEVRGLNIETNACVTFAFFVMPVVPDPAVSV